MDKKTFLPSLFMGMYTAKSRVAEWSEVAEIICGEQLKSSTEKYRTQAALGLDADANKVKQWMPALCPVVQCDGGRRRQHFVGFTGVGMCDFDHLADVGAAFRTACADPHAFLVYRTISGHGVRVLFRYVMSGQQPIPSPQDYRGEAPGFTVANNYFARLLGAEADMKCKNIGRLSVLCHDAEAVLRMDAEPFVVCPNTPEKAKSFPLKRAVRAIESHLASEGLEYAPGTYNEYVMRTCYYLNSLGVAREKAEQWAVERFNDYDSQQVRSIIASCYAHVDEFATMSVHALSKKSAAADKAFYASVDDIENFLSSAAKFRYNVITRKTEMALNNTSSLIPNLSSRKGDSPFLELTDRDVNSLWARMSKTGLKVKLQHLYNVICSDYVPQWNPFEDYFYSLPEWDGTTDYIAQVAEMVSIRSSDNSRTSNPSSQNSHPSSDTGSSGVQECRSSDNSRTSNPSSLSSNPSSDAGSGSNSSPQHPVNSSTSQPSKTSSSQSLNSSTHQLVNSSTFTSCFRKWLVAMVASLLNKNVVNNTILVFVGRQGIYKTTFFNNLLPPELHQYFFTKTNSDRMTKDDKLSLAEFALICLEEIDSMKTAELNQLKALVTSKTISERAAYERFKECRQHIASFCGTGNNIRFLTDDSGNRRWLPFEVENIDEPRPEKYHYTGLYSQALALWRSGFRYWFNQKEIEALYPHLSHFEVTSTEEELLLNYFRKPLPGEQHELLTCSNIVEKINILTKRPLSPILVGRALRKHDFESVHNRKGTFYSIVEYSGAEIAMNKKGIAPQADDVF